MKELRASNQLFNKKLQEERRIARETVKKERVREKEMKAQEQAQKKQQKQAENLYNNPKGAIEQPQRKLHSKGSVWRGALQLQVVIKVVNHLKLHHPKSPELGATSPFQVNSDSTN
jgi:hypothetical protein